MSSESKLPSEIQAVIFDRRRFTTDRARKWLKEHNLKAIKRVDKKGNQLRYRLRSPSRYKRFITKKTSKAISFIIGFR